MLGFCDCASRPFVDDRQPFYINFTFGKRVFLTNSILLNPGGNSPGFFIWVGLEILCPAGLAPSFPPLHMVKTKTPRGGEKRWWCSSSWRSGWPGWCWYWCGSTVWWLFIAVAWGIPPVKLVVLLDNQDGAVEGFLRRLAVRCQSLWPRSELAVIVDDPCTDLTGDIVRLLAREMGFITLTAKEAEAGEGAALGDMLKWLPGEPREGWAGGTRPTWYYDARGLQGRDLLSAPVLRQMGRAA